MATITINTTSAQDQRIIAAYRGTFDPEATGADVKALLIQQITSMVHSYETQQAAIAAADGVTRMDDAT